MYHRNAIHEVARPVRRKVMQATDEREASRRVDSLFVWFDDACIGDRNGCTINRRAHEEPASSALRVGLPSNKAIIRRPFCRGRTTSPPVPIVSRC